MDTFCMDGIFGKMVDNMFGDEIRGALKEAEENKDRPGVTTLSFVPIPSSRAEEIKKAKVGLFDIFKKKNLINSIEEGRTTYSEVLVLARCYKVIDRDEEDPRFSTYKYYYKIADPDGNVICEDVPVLDDEYAVSFELNNGDSASDTGCPDKVDPAGYEHMILINYYLKDSPYYVLVSKEQFNDLSVLARYAGCLYHYTREGVGYRW